MSAPSGGSAEPADLTAGYTFEQSRAVAVDMESATIAANGFRYRIPSATLLAIVRHG